MKGPIGIFDSGYGGLTVLESIRTLMPQYDYIYFGDNARSPYGTRDFDTVYEYTLECVQALFDKGCPLVILACNTASAKALRSIQQKDLDRIAPNNRVLGVIRPSAEVVGQYSNSKHIGILATEGTVQSESYLIEIKKFYPEIKVYQEACPMWVPLIENHQHESDAGRIFIRQNVENLLSQSNEIDTIILGCTHYPLVKNYIESILPNKNIKVISQGPIIAESLLDYLMRHPEIESRLLKAGNIDYYTSGDPSTFDNHANEFITDAVKSQKLHL